MRLLEYLVPSRARREVLKALRARGSGLSARQLARTTGLAYSNVHRELERMKDAGLARSERVGNTVLCSWNAAHPAAKAMDRLLLASEDGKAASPGDGTLFWNLKRWGAPLAHAGAKGEALSLEETLAYALVLARRHPEVARVWPVVFAKHRPDVDLRRLAQASGRLGQKRALGFFLALTRRLLKDESLAPGERALRDRRFRKTQDFFLTEDSERGRRLADLRTPALARDWRFRMNMPLESFQAPFEKFVLNREALR
jgi:DNA-binding transcriptional ArsR family regulator